MHNSIIFLGVCDRLQPLNQPHPYLPKYDLIGFKNTIFYSVFPCNLNGMFFVFSIQQITDLPLRISGEFPNNQECFFLTIDKLSTISKNEGIEELISNDNQLGSVINLDSPMIWTFFPVKIPDGVMIEQPTTVTIFAKSKETKEPIGQLQIMYAEPSPFTLDRIDALRSNPNAFKSVRMQIKCTKCGDFLNAYSGLAKSLAEEDEGWIWYQSVPDRFVCKCNSTNINLSYVRKNLFTLLEFAPTKDEKLEFHRLYEKDALEQVNINYWKLLDQTPSEETIQVFLEKNPLFLESFHPTRIFHKSPILSKFKTDFTVIGNNGNLYLIEIERSNIRLLKKDGSKASDLEHAITQVKDWLYFFELHKMACLECLNISHTEVNKIHGVVIAGRDSNYPKESLTKLKWEDFGNNISFYTYDDLGRNFDGLLKHFQQV